jgi:hypothetical protein
MIRSTDFCESRGALCDLRSARLAAVLDGVLVDFKAANPREIDWLVVRVAARGAECVEVLRARPELEDVDASGIHRISRHGEVKTSRCLAGEAHGIGTREDVGVSIHRIEDEVASDYEHPPIVPRDRFRSRAGGS